MLHKFTCITAESLNGTWLFKSIRVCPNCLEKISKRVNICKLTPRPWKVMLVFDPDRFFDTFQDKEGVMCFLDSDNTFGNVFDDQCAGCGKNGQNSWRGWADAARINNVVDQVVDHLTKLNLYNELRRTKSMIETTKTFLSPRIKQH